MIFGALIAIEAVISLGRWLRVSQREHYLAGSGVTSAKRWLRQRPPNKALALLWAVATVGVLVARLMGHDAPGVGVATGLLGAALPIGMAIIGQPRLRLTRRLLYQTLTACVLSGAALATMSIGLGVGLTAALSPLVVLISVDLGAWCNQPLERRMARKFQRVADEKLQRVRPRVVAVTGSFGKTTVKNHIRDLIGSSFDVLATPASWNNRAGLSRAINERLTPSTEVFIAEMGTYGPGEIQELVEWLKPEVAVITAVGPVHLERMRTIEVIAAAKAEILVGARVAIICVDTPLLADLAAATRRSGAMREVWSVGSDVAQPDLDVLVCTGGNGVAPDGSLDVFVRGQFLARVPHSSLHPGNVACAVAAALAIGVQPRVIERTLPGLTAPPHRAVAVTTEDGLVVIDDTFNSNPSGAASALASLATCVRHGRRVVVSPGMVELGGLQFAANRDFAQSIKAEGAELVVVGWTNRAALLAGHPGAVAVANREDARRWVRANLASGDGVLWENDLPDHYP